MATRVRATHFLISLIAPWIDALKRTLIDTVGGASGSTTPAFTGTAPANAEVDVVTGTGYATAGQVVTTSDVQTLTLNQLAGCWLHTATHAPCLIVSHPAVTGAAVALTVFGAAPATTAEAYRVTRAPTPAGAVAAHTHPAGGAAAVVHYDRGEYAITAANSSSLETARTLLKAIGTNYHAHVNDALAHDAIDSGNDIIDLGAGESLQDDFFPGAADADLNDLCSMANDIKGLFNTHRSEAGVHPTDDTGHAIAAVDATDQSSLNTLANELKADFNLHIADGFAVPSWRVVPT